MNNAKYQHTLKVSKNSKHDHAIWSLQGAQQLQRGHTTLWVVESFAITQDHSNSHCPLEQQFL